MKISNIDKKYNIFKLFKLTLKMKTFKKKYQII